MIVRERDRSVESMRGLAILMVVMGHVIGSDSGGGMQVGDHSWLRYVYHWIDYIQMPLFTAIAGWVYAYNSERYNSLSGFIELKFRRLIIPMVMVGTLYFVVQYLIPGTNITPKLSSIWRICVFPFTYYWYLQALFLIFLMVFAADSLKLVNHIEKWCVMLITALFLYLAARRIIPHGVINLFSFKGAFIQLPWFVVGVGIKRFGEQIFTKRLMPLYLMFSILGVLMLQIRWFFPQSVSSFYELILPLWIVPTLILLFNLQFSSRLLVFFGTYAYSIYLFHGFGTSGGRIILSYMGIYNDFAIFTLSFALGIFLPVVADRILSRYKPLSTLFLGKY